MKHYKGCSGHLCPCGEVDLTIRLSPEAQLDAIYEAEYYWYRLQDDPGSDWIGYLIDKLGWSEDRVYGRAYAR